MKTNAIVTAPEVVNGSDDDDFNMPAHNGPRWVPQPQQRTGGLSALPADEASLLVRQALQSLPHVHSGISPTDDGNNKVATIGLMEAIEPKDAIEGMIAAQIVGLHNVTMDCLKRAHICTGPERDTALQQANKTSRTFGQLVETLNKHRGKGRQTMVVEHVHVHQGGQAIVGQVEGSLSRRRGKLKKARTIT